MPALSPGAPAMPAAIGRGLVVLDGHGPGGLAGSLGDRNLKVVHVREFDDPADEEQQDGSHETKFDGGGPPLAPFNARAGRP